MNKIGTGIVALSAGMLLTLGGATSIAYWQDQASAGELSFTTGDMNVTRYGERWSFNGVTLTDEEGDSAREQISRKLFVPGSTAVLEQEFDIDQNGSELYLELDVAVGELVAGNDTSGTAAEAISASYALVERDLAGDPSGVSFEQVGETNTYRVTGKGPFVLAVTIAWPFGNSADSSNTTEGKVVNLEETTVTLRQVAGPVV